MAVTSEPLGGNAVSALDRQICAIVASLYGDDPQGFDDLLWPEADDGVCLGLKRLPGADLVVLRGSVTEQDFARDAAALPAPFCTHPSLGWVHPGFLEGLETVLGHVKALRRGGTKTILAGHSLGAGRAAELGGLLIAEEPSIAIEAVLFGEPRSGSARLRALWAPKPYRSYRNADPNGCGHDLVTDFPTDPPYGRNRKLVDVFGAPAPDDPWLLFKYHHMALYQEGLAALR